MLCRRVEITLLGKCVSQAVFDDGRTQVVRRIAAGADSERRLVMRNRFIHLSALKKQCRDIVVGDIVIFRDRQRV